MTIRFLPRHVIQTVYDFTVDRMTALGWVGSDVPFGALPVKFFNAPIRDNLEASRLEPNAVAVYGGIEQELTPIELGGSLHTQVFPMFAEVYGENTGIALSIASDIRDTWLGRNGSSVLSIRDYSQTPVVDVSGCYIDLGVSVERGPMENKYLFQVIGSYAELVLPEGGFV